MKRTEVISSNLKSVGYDENTLTLEVEFFDFNVYQYSPVTRDAYNAMMNSSSIGSYFSKNIRNNKDIKTEKVSS